MQQYGHDGASVSSEAPLFQQIPAAQAATGSNRQQHAAAGSDKRKRQHRQTKHAEAKDVASAANSEQQAAEGRTARTCMTVAA